MTDLDKWSKALNSYNKNPVTTPRSRGIELINEVSSRDWL